MKKIGFVLLLLVVGVFFWIYWAHLPTQPEDNYAIVKKYSEPKRAFTDTLVVMTYNLGYLSGMTNNLPMDRPDSLIMENLHSAQALINTLNPDIIGFQEIDFNSERSFAFNQLDSIALSGVYASGYQSVNWDKNYVPFPYWPPNKNFGRMLSGQAVLSRFEVAQAETVTLMRPMDAPYFYELFYLDRLVQIVDLKIGEQSVKVMNVHLEAFDEATREAQAFEVKELYEEYAELGPVLLIGDFNSKPDYERDSNKALKVLMTSRYLRSAVIEGNYLENPSDFYSFNSDKPYQMIDYLFYNDNFIKNLSVDVVQKAGQISDHLPLIGKFLIMRPND